MAEALLADGYTELSYRRFRDGQTMGDTPRRVFARANTLYPASQLLPKYRVETVLRAKLAALGGAVEWASKLTELTPSAAGVTCRLRPAGELVDFVS